MWDIIWRAAVLAIAIAPSFVLMKIMLQREVKKTLSDEENKWWKEVPKGKRSLPAVSVTNLEITVARDLGVFAGSTLEAKIAQALAYRRRRIEADHGFEVGDETSRFSSSAPPALPSDPTLKISIPPLPLPRIPK